MLVIVACGGSGLEFVYPNTKEVTIEFRNTSGAALNMGMVGDLQSQAAGTTRTERQTRTWLSEGHEESFFMQADAPAGVALVSIKITGKESHAQNFHGILVTWNGTQLSATTQ